MGKQNCYNYAWTGKIIKKSFPDRVDRKEVSDSYWLKTHPVPSDASCQTRVVSFERFPWLWQDRFLFSMNLTLHSALPWADQITPLFDDILIPQENEVF